jgi:uncharacterized membrane protein YpjA
MTMKKLTKIVKTKALKVYKKMIVTAGLILVMSIKTILIAGILYRPRITVALIIGGIAVAYYLASGIIPNRYRTYNKNKESKH